MNSYLQKIAKWDAEAGLNPKSLKDKARVGAARAKYTAQDVAAAAKGVAGKVGAAAASAGKGARNVGYASLGLAGRGYNAASKGANAVRGMSTKGKLGLAAGAAGLVGAGYAAHKAMKKEAGDLDHIKIAAVNELLNEGYDFDTAVVSVKAVLEE